MTIARKFAPSTASVGIAEKARENAELLRSHRAAAREQRDFEWVFADLRRYDELLREHSGTRLADARVLEIGFGARPYRLVAMLASGVDARGVDAETPVIDGSLRELAAAYRTNGLERALKSLIRYALFDRAERARFRSALAARDLRWTLDRNQLRVDQTFDGIYCLLTNLSEAEASSQDVFSAYKGQSQVEGRFRAIKQPPIEVRPIWLHQPRRIESLLFVVMVALYLFALIEREARRVVRASGQVFKGLRPEGRDNLPVTAERLFEVFAPLSLVIQRLRIGAEVLETFTSATLSPIQAEVLDRLGLPRPDVYLQPSITPHPS